MKILVCRPKLLTRKGVVLSALFISGIRITSAQESLNAGGGNASAAEGSVSFSIGQVFYTSNNGSSGSEAQGIQQAYEILTLYVGPIQNEGLVSVYPNPASEVLVVETKFFNSMNLIYRLFDMHGKLIQSGPVSAPRTSLNVSWLTPACYFLQIRDEANQITYAIKIINKI